MDVFPRRKSIGEEGGPFVLMWRGVSVSGFGFPPSSRVPRSQGAKEKINKKKPVKKNGKRRRKPLSYGTALASQSHFCSALWFLSRLSRQITQRPIQPVSPPCAGDARCQGIGERCGSNRPADWFDWFDWLDWFANLGATQD